MRRSNPEVIDFFKTEILRFARKDGLKDFFSGRLTG
jgi:hypothetical protein